MNIVSRSPLFFITTLPLQLPRLYTHTAHHVSTVQSKYLHTLPSHVLRALLLQSTPVSRNRIYTHQCPISTPAPSKKPIRVVCISDTHNSCPSLPSGNIMIHAGDLTNSGTFPELQRQLNWLSSRPHLYKLAIAGNHDLILDQACHGKQKDLFAPPYAWERKNDLQWRDTIYLEDETTTLSIRRRSINIHGSPHTPEQGNWAFQYPRHTSSQSTASSPSAPTPSSHSRLHSRQSEKPKTASQTRHSTVPPNTHTLITHGPSRGHLDAQQGCPALRSALWRVKPRLHVHGHMHRGRGTETLDWGIVQWCYDQVQTSQTNTSRANIDQSSLGGGCFYKLGSLMLMLVVWAWEWRLYFVFATRRCGRSVIVNAAWGGNEDSDITVVEV